MRHTTFDEGAGRSMWPALVIVAGAALTTWFTCITPFVAFSVMAATTLSRRGGLVLTIAAWLANQAVGYGMLHYPWTVTSVAWGVTIGMAAVLATVAAQEVGDRLRSAPLSTRGLTAFVAAFAVYELALYAMAVSSLGGAEAFAPRIVGQVLLVNAATLVGLWGVHQLLTTVRLAAQRRRGVRASSAPVA